MNEKDPGTKVSVWGHSSQTLNETGVFIYMYLVTLGWLTWAMQVHSIHGVFGVDASRSTTAPGNSQVALLSITACGQGLNLQAPPAPSAKCTRSPKTSKDIQRLFCIIVPH